MSSCALMDGALSHRRSSKLPTRTHAVSSPCRELHRHLDDVDDDEKLDFVLPTSKRKTSWMSSVCWCCSVGTDRTL